jgi:hypothetical protein
MRLARWDAPRQSEEIAMLQKLFHSNICLRDALGLKAKKLPRYRADRERTA